MCCPHNLEQFIIGVTVMILTLFIYKYLGYTIYLADKFLKLEFSAPNLIVPLGISYIIFSAVSFLVDVYRCDAPVKNFFETFLYLAFFPKVICGPIVLYKNFVNANNTNISIDLFLSGLNRIIIGFAKKILLADYFGSVVNNIANAGASGIDWITSAGVVLLYGLQLYYDFSGYSDIAIGVAKTLGFNFEENFRFPYTAFSITDFWRKWHISLGTFFKEYVYIPLGGNRKGKTRTLINLGIVFLVTGIWHGAGLNYLLWGALHGTIRIFEKLLQNNKIYNATPKIIKWVGTMLIIFLGWQLFRVTDMGELCKFMSVLFGFAQNDNVNFTWEYYFGAKLIFFVLVALLGSTIPANTRVRSLYTKLSQNAVAVGAIQILLLCLFAISLMCMINSGYSPFMYYQY